MITVRMALMVMAAKPSMACLHPRENLGPTFT
jgi:hypothetical protein